MIKVRLVQADVPNANGRVYPRDVLESALKAIQKNRLFAQFGMPEGTSIDLLEIAASVGNFSFDDEGFLCAELIALETPKGKVLTESLVSTEFDYRPAGIGRVDKNGVITDYRFTSIGVLSKGSGA